jgi:hypothetical protein
MQIHDELLRRPTFSDDVDVTLLGERCFDGDQWISLGYQRSAIGEPGMS